MARSTWVGAAVIATASVLLLSWSLQPSTAQASPSYLFVVSGEAGTIDGVGQDTGDEVLTLTLAGVNDHATQFADRPIRTAYVLSTADLVDRWNGWFADAAPNAVLSFTEPGDPLPHNIVVELANPAYDKSARTLTFTAKHLHRAPDLSPDAKEQIELPQRQAPAAFTAGTLFIDSVSDETAPEGTDAVGAETEPEPEAANAALGAPASANELQGGQLLMQPASVVNGCVIEAYTVCRGANLSDAILVNATLLGADLTGANLAGANLQNANLRGADLTGANLVGAQLNYIKTQSTNFTKANLSYAEINEARLSATDFSGADLRGAQLYNSRLTGSTLTGANFADAYLYRALIYGVDLTDVTLTGATWVDGSRKCAAGSIGVCR